MADYSTSAASRCTECPTGKFSASGASVCTKCSPGSYTPFLGSTACLVCSAGSYSGKGASTCTTCQASRWSKLGARNCSLCDVGYYLDRDQLTCSECPTEGVSCDKTGQKLSRLDIDHGYFRASVSTKRIHKCPMSTTACAGGKNFSRGGDGYCHKVCSFEWMNSYFISFLFAI